MRDSLDSVTSARAKLEAETQTHAARAAADTATIHSLRERIAELEETSKRARELERVEGILAALEATHAGTCQTLLATEADLAVRTSELTEQTARAARAEERALECEATNAELRSKLRELTLANDVLKARLDAGEGDVDTTAAAREASVRLEMAAVERDRDALLRQLAVARLSEYRERDALDAWARSLQALQRVVTQRRASVAAGEAGHSASAAEQEDAQIKFHDHIMRVSDTFKRALRQVEENGVNLRVETAAVLAAPDQSALSAGAFGGSPSQSARGHSITPGSPGIDYSSNTARGQLPMTTPRVLSATSQPMAGHADPLEGSASLALTARGGHFVVAKPSIHASPSGTAGAAPPDLHAAAHYPQLARPVRDARDAELPLEKFLSRDLFEMVMMVVGIFQEQHVQSQQQHVGSKVDQQQKLRESVAAAPVSARGGGKGIFGVFKSK
jgi:hypothetical protein